MDASCKIEDKATAVLFGSGFLLNSFAVITLEHLSSQSVEMILAYNSLF